MSTRVRLTYDTVEGTAAGIYGIIIGAAVIAASHGRSALAIDVSVLITLGVYWAAERYRAIA
jgi:hypothetical protein